MYPHTTFNILHSRHPKIPTSKTPANSLLNAYDGSMSAHIATKPDFSPPSGLFTSVMDPQGHRTSPTTSSSQSSNAHSGYQQAAPRAITSFPRNSGVQQASSQPGRITDSNESTPIHLFDFTDEEVDLFCRWYNSAPRHIRNQVWKRVRTGQVTWWRMPITSRLGTVTPPSPPVTPLT
ncbi:hypothetical protein CC80DRAFT_82398 [Byssothecium circinans]|uniref:Uncharacterized protein n=1 Tax=Byssothecium circinans TaxID=147558 RepID=A0A6A5TUG8_9PLEO|nr:hypothetical protein CC80DRAFT_82398 [Byssothecium circinans]